MEVRNIIDVHNLTYYYQHKHKALDGISFHVPEGSIYGFLGPNGAGKSTTMRMLSGIYPDDNQSISLFGKTLSSQLPDVYKMIGSLIEQPVLYQHLNAQDHLEWVLKSNGLPLSEMDYFLDLVDLSKAKKIAIRKYSLGMKQRLAIAICLIKHPKLLLLDEPVNGLDPSGMMEVRSILMKLNQQAGVTIFVSSHLLSELEKMCTHIGIIHNGNMKYTGKMESLNTTFSKKPLKIQIENNVGLIHLENYEWNLNQNELTVYINDKAEIPNIIEKLVHQGVSIFSVHQDGNLESWFMELTQN